MAKSKFICVKQHHNNHTTLWCGTLQALIRVFSYTLKCGHSRRSSINMNPRGLKSLVSSLNKSYNACNIWSDWAEESTYDEFIAAGGVIEEGEEYRYVSL